MVEAPTELTERCCSVVLVMLAVVMWRWWTQIAAHAQAQEERDASSLCTHPPAAPRRVSSGSSAAGSVRYRAGGVPARVAVQAEGLPEGTTSSGGGGGLRAMSARERYAQLMEVLASSREEPQSCDGDPGDAGDAASAMFSRTASHLAARHGAHAPRMQAGSYAGSGMLRSDTCIHEGDLSESLRSMRDDAATCRGMGRRHLRAEDERCGISHTDSSLYQSSHASRSPYASFSSSHGSLHAVFDVGVAPYSPLPSPAAGARYTSSGSRYAAGLLKRRSSTTVSTTVMRTASDASSSSTDVGRTWSRSASSCVS